MGGMITYIRDIASSIVSAFSYIIGIFKTLWFWLTSLLSWLWDLINQVFTWGVFDTLWIAFNQLQYYIWTPATIFITTLFAICIFRIWLAFVFKIFRLNIDYKPKSPSEKTYNTYQIYNFKK